GLDAGEDRLPDPLTGRSGRIAAWGGQPPPTQPARDDPGHWAILPRATSAALQEGRPLRVQALELGPELGVAGEVRVVTDDPPGVLVGRDDEVLVAGQPAQSDAASCPGLRRPQHVALAALGQVAPRQPESVGGPRPR